MSTQHLRSEFMCPTARGLIGRAIGHVFKTHHNKKTGQRVERCCRCGWVKPQVKKEVGS